MQFAIDDFGTGYSSLSYLKQLPMQTLKIDRSFVHDMLEDPDDLAIVDGIVGLANAFRRQVIAEGIETVEHGSMLIHLGCDQGQGYCIARPMPGDRLPAWVRDWQAPAAWLEAVHWPPEDSALLTVEIDHIRWIRQFAALIEAPPRAVGGHAGTRPDGLPFRAVADSGRPAPLSPPAQLCRHRADA